MSGGSTPLPVLKILRDFNLNWDSFNFFLVDERFVDVNSDESNYKNIFNVFFKFISSKTYPFLLDNHDLDNLRLLCPNCYLSFNGHFPSSGVFYK